MTTFQCPLSAETVAHPCPVHSCPANLAAYNPTNSCAHQLNDLSYYSLAEAMSMDPTDVKHQSQNQATKLASVLRDLHFALNHPVQEPCPRCGYPKGCKNTSLCAERQKITTAICVKVSGKGSTLLKPVNLWSAVLHERASFLSDKQRSNLRELTTKGGISHVRHQPQIKAF